MSSLTSIVTEISSDEALGNTYAVQVSWSVLTDDGQVDPRAAHEQAGRSRLHKATSRARDGHRVPFRSAGQIQLTDADRVGAGESSLLCGPSAFYNLGK